MTRSDNVARNAMSPTSNIPSTGGDTPLSVANVGFYSDYVTKAPATSGLDAKFIEVTLAPQLVDFLFAQIYSAMFGGAATTNGKYVEMFITQEVKDPPNAAIYAEIVR